MTRSILILWPLILAVVLLDGCKRAEAQHDKIKPNVSEFYGSDTIVRVFTDPETGCQYLGMYGEAVTPRMGRDGKQICREVK